MEILLELGDIRENTCTFMVAQQLIKKGYIEVGHDILKTLLSYVSSRPQDPQSQQWLLPHIQNEFQELEGVVSYTDELQFMIKYNNDLNLDTCVIVAGNFTTTFFI